MNGLLLWIAILGLPLVFALIDLSRTPKSTGSTSRNDARYGPGATGTTGAGYGGATRTPQPAR